MLRKTTRSKLLGTIRTKALRKSYFVNRTLKRVANLGKSSVFHFFEVYIFSNAVFSAVVFGGRLLLLTALRFLHSLVHFAKASLHLPGSAVDGYDEIKHQLIAEVKQ